MNNINKQIIATQMPGLRPQNVRPGLIQSQIPILPFQGTTATKTTPTIGNFVTATNNAGPSYFLVPSSALPGQSMVATSGNVNNTTGNNSATKSIAQLISTNQITQNKAKIMFLTTTATAPGQIKTAQIGQTVNFAAASPNKTIITAPNPQKIITGIPPSSAGQTFQFFTAISGPSYGQSKFPVHVTSTTTNTPSIINKTATATQIVTVIDNQNGQHQIHPAGPTCPPQQSSTKSEPSTKVIIPATITSIASTSPIVVRESIEMDPEEARKLLEANEELESSGSSSITDTSTELVPGISNFYEKKENDHSYFEEKELEEWNHLQNDHQSSIDTSNVRKVSCSFGFTEYGVTSISKPVLSKGIKRTLKDDNSESDSKTKASLSSGNKNLSTSTTVTTSTPTHTGSTTPSTKISSNNNTQYKKLIISNNGDFKSTKWQNEMDPEEIANIHAFASLSSTVLLKKLKDIHNTAFHLAIEEEKEMLKARFLNILDNHTETNINGHSCNLGGSDFAYSESKLCQTTESCSR